MTVLDSEIVGCRAIRPKVIRDQLSRNEAVLLQKLSHEIERGILVPIRLDQYIEDLAFGVDGCHR